MKNIYMFFLFFFSFTSIGNATEEIEKRSTEEYEEETPWINGFHSAVSDSVYMSAAWFDEFFTEEGSVQQNQK